MSERLCPQCGQAVENDAAVFCPYCGGSLKQSAVPTDSEHVQKLIAQATTERDPAKRLKLLTQAQAEAPDSLAVAEELLFLGRLPERNPRKLDFSVIKCYLLQPYLEPDTVTDEEKARYREELFSHPQLERCLALSDSRDAYMRHYLTRLSREFINLFLRGSSRYMHRFMGFQIGGSAAKLLATPTARMIVNIRGDDALTAPERAMLASAVIAAFAQEFGDDRKYLQTTLAEVGVPVE